MCSRLLLNYVVEKVTYGVTWQDLNDEINQNTNFAKLTSVKRLFLVYITVNLKSKHLVCLSFLWWQFFWGSERKCFTHILGSSSNINIVVNAKNYSTFYSFDMVFAKKISHSLRFLNSISDFCYSIKSSNRTDGTGIHCEACTMRIFLLKLILMTYLNIRLPTP